jgi:hypothetical protein
MHVTTLGIPVPDATDHTRLWEHFDGMADFIDVLLQTKPTITGWTAYAPAMSSSGGGLVATSTGRYRDIGDDREVEIRSTITVLGAAGVYNWALPSAPVAPTAAWDPLGVGTAVDVSASLRVGLTALFSGGANISMANSTARVGNTVPFAAAVGDTYSIRARYQRV